MRVSSLVILVAIILGALYLFFVRPQWATDLFLKSTGYGPAASATEALDKFLKCVKNRDLETAARYCSGEYAEQLKRGAQATKELGPVIDSISECMKNKGLATDKSVTLLHFLDPFPPNIKIVTAPKEKGDSAVAVCGLDLSLWPNKETDPIAFLKDLGSVDTRMFTRVFAVNVIDPKGFEIAKEDGSWKLKCPLFPNQAQAVDFYVNNYKSYLTGLTIFRRDVTNERYASKQEFENQLLKVMQESK